jgi:A/G-specific adenine glycosylase
MARAKKQSARAGERKIARNLLAWYDVSARALPWREPPGILQDPYRVWLSEIMLQQTTVKAVIPYYQKFLARWPRVEDLAAAALDDVLAAWAGLGYYSRARNLHACAKAVAEQHGGRFPDDEAELLKLPGIGAYTAAAIAAIAFDRPAAAVDGNIERVVARLFAVEDPLPASKPKIRALAASLVPSARPGDFTQAMMDLGANICSPRSPSCMICPLTDHCEARRLGIAATLPIKAPKKERPTRYGAAFVACRQDGAVLLRQRPPKGLLGGMLEVPSTEWTGERAARRDQIKAAPFDAQWQPLAGTVGHTFTHFHLELEIFHASNISLHQTPDGYKWHCRTGLGNAALPSVMHKILRHALQGE